MTSTKPYLIRALCEWIIDNDFTPHIVVNTSVPGVQVPQQYVESGRIILNISPSATQGLELGQEWIIFEARFDHDAMCVRVPVISVLAIYARENGRGMVFDEQYDMSDQGGEEGGDDVPPIPTSPTGKPKLTVIK